MNAISQLSYIYNSLLQGQITVLTPETVSWINSMTTGLLEITTYNNDDLIIMDYIIKISNIVYENTSRLVLPLDDGVYDLLYEVYKKNVPDFTVGSVNVEFKDTVDQSSKDLVNLISFADPKPNDMLYEKYITPENAMPIDMLIRPKEIREAPYINKRVVDMKHEYPNLVGTLDKCKFVLCNQAAEKGVLDDPKVKIVERDFFGDHIMKGILDPNRKFSIAAELKYDGVSIEATCTDQILSARSRGDAVNDIAADYTPILGGYKFPYAEGLINDPIGVKFEAIMTYDNLYQYNILKGKNYKNCRTAIIGLLGSSDAYKFRDFITLVPLATSVEDIDRLVDIEFGNKVFSTLEKMRYTVIEGNYVEVLYKLNIFVQEAEFLRAYIPFMYDGVVIEYIDQDLRERLGRENAINKYAMAIKFNPLKKLTTFRGYTYTVGQDGSITPMIHFDPVEFYGTIHPKTTGHSYQRFKELALRKNDVIEAEYVNDVIVYVNKPVNNYNCNNPEPLEEFPTTCPSCGGPITISATGKTAYCTNLDCPERRVTRLANMMDKLNLKDFAEETLAKIDKYHLYELLNLAYDDLVFLGPTNAQKFIDRMNEIKTKPIYDYKIVGALGFNGIAIETWKKIFANVTLQELLFVSDIEMRRMLLSGIKGIGRMTIDTIIEQFEYFTPDLVEICENMSNVITTKGMKAQKTIRFTGFRDAQLMQQLNDMGYDASEGGVTKTTDILLIPHIGFTSSKTAKAGPNTQIIPVEDFERSINL